MSDSIFIRDLLKEIRQDHTTSQVSHALGHKFDKYYRFENNYQKMHVFDFIELCNLFNLDLRQILKKSLGIEATVLNQESILKALTSTWGDISETQLQSHLNYSRSKWWRIKSNKVKLRLEDFFNIVDALTGRKELLISKFTTHSKKKSLKDRKVNYSKAMNLLKENPEIAIITSAIYLKEYREAEETKKEKILLKKTGLDKPRLFFLVNLMVNNKIIYIKDGNYVVSSFKTQLSDEEVDISSELNRFVLNKACFSIENQEKDRFLARNFKIAPVSKDSKKEISKILNSAYKEISKVIDSDDPDNRDDVVAIYSGSFEY